eukprot:7023733-Karenia_brevis.AAC.1
MHGDYPPLVGDSPFSASSQDAGDTMTQPIVRSYSALEPSARSAGSSRTVMLDYCSKCVKEFGGCHDHCCQSH